MPPSTEQGVVAGLPEQQVAGRAAGEGVVAGAAEQVGSGQRAVGFVEAEHVVAGEPEDSELGVFATVGVPPLTETLAPVTRILPAASRLTSI